MIGNVNVADNILLARRRFRKQRGQPCSCGSVGAPYRSTNQSWTSGCAQASALALEVMLKF